MNIISVKNLSKDFGQERVLTASPAILKREGYTA